MLFRSGCGDTRILFRHVLPNIFAPIIVIATVYLGNAIITEASLSFLGMGSPPPNTSWGAILSGSGRQYLESAPWIAIFPGIAVDGGRVVWGMTLRLLQDLFTRLGRPLTFPV